ncbi:MAG: 2,3-dihydroxybiphenyl 1,2-dioxygenase, partial [Halioglobus sp.]
MSVASIGYVRIESLDPDAWMNFGMGVLGLMEAPREDPHNARFLRMDAHPFRFMIEAGSQDRLAACGLEFRTEALWQDCCDRLSAAGHSVESGTAAEAERRCVSGFATTRDPSGNVLELYYGRKL